MKIERGYGEYKEHLLQSKKKQAETAYSQSKVIPAAKDNIDLSETTQKIRQTQANEKAETARSEKVAALKKAIQEGTYQVSAEEIATSMVQAMKTAKD